VYGLSAAVSTPAPTLQWLVWLARLIKLLPTRHGMLTPERLLIPQETDPDGPVFPVCAKPTTAEKWAPCHVETGTIGLWMVTLEAL
jgi:hypothetical protein